MTNMNDERMDHSDISRKNYGTQKEKWVVSGGTGFPDGCIQTVSLKVGVRGFHSGSGTNLKTQSAVWCIYGLSAEGGVRRFTGIITRNF